MKPVLLVITGSTFSKAAISRTAHLAAGAPVTVVGVHVPSGSPESTRRAVALAMSALENTGVMALGHIAITGSPARAVARVARARGARVVVVDQACGLATELRRRMYGSGIAVVSAAEPGGPGTAVSR